ncbi:AEC family transporter [Lactiplantibacillus plantarum]|uniref:AEC family transporter n=1 Tax=Lactiplantibacillus plantarum TaxID=1590 RepID=UPI001F4D0D78|nr:AEC family transporter [Lactiplantibacillus plantarum]MCH8624125.1 AEC family transporter [Lactiplantibacillus plantarum]MCH8630212.1 AEC family transporter [Lactiplantibacillus plantarum]MCH8633220.1 AEC family transporter [Lactiplantibacillus plantarum]
MGVLWNSIQSVLVVVLIMILGFVLRRAGWFDDKFAGTISKFIKNIALPASIFVSVLSRLTRGQLGSFAGYLAYAFLAVIIGYLIAFALVKIMRVRPGRKGIFINAIVNANTIFIGLPLNIALFGDKSMTYFLVYYIVNTVSTWAFGVFLISNDDPTKSKEKTHNKIDWKKVIPMPLVGFLVALIFLLLNIPIMKVSFVSSTLTYVGNLVTPLSLIYIGIVLADVGLKSIRFDRDTIVALIGRFILSPIIMILVLMVAGNLGASFPTLASQTLIVQSATPMLAVLPILANEAHGDVEYATNIVTTSTVLFIVVVPVLMTLIQYI